MTPVKRRMPLPLALALGALGLTIVVQVASATHPRLKGATPVRVPLVPAYEPCTSANSKHGAPLASPSCNPPVQASNYLTVGTPDADGADANSVGFVRVDVKATSPEDVLTSGSISDVRCKAATDAGVCNGANAAGGPDYSGDLEGNATARATDHYNGDDLNEAATVGDIPNPFIFHCLNTPDTSVGGTCTVDTSRPLIPQPYWFEGKRVVVELTQIQVSDGGADGNVFTEPKDNTLFAVQGLFVP